MKEPMKEPNRLIHEISPYLLQHARNPVDWFPWGPEALAKAKKEDKPILLSIGYSACHWCHVMAHETFEDEAIARKMNEMFVNIKVDREERPDVDAIYMKSIVAMTGHGGWPLNVFLTPDQEPYLGGTYFPPAPKYNRPGFPQVLEQAHDLYKNRKNNLQTRVEKVLQNLQSAEEKKPASSSAEESSIDQAVAILAERYDEEAGGFGQGMKFPEPMIYSLLLRHWLRTESDETLTMLDKSLTGMAEGGMYDQLGGGFHRYSTDRNWRVPHFEKMLVDNALLAKLYLEMFQATKQEIYKTIPGEIFEYVLREMTSPQGYFYSSQDADTDGREGEFYAWELKEVLNLLGPRPAKVLARAYGLTPAGNFERKNVLHIKDSMETIAEQEDMPIFEVQHLLNSGKKTLLETRQRRKPPERDEKMITAWNGLMITAFATGFMVLRESRWLDAALKCADFIWSNMWRQNRLLRIHKDGESRIEGCLDDTASLLQGFIALYEATFDTLWIERARQLADRMIAEFYDEEAGGFFMTGDSHEKLIVRLKSAADEAMPSANSIAALSLLQLAALTGDKPYQKKAEHTVRAFQSRMQSSPAAYTGLLGVVDALSIAPVEIVFAGPRDQQAAKEMLRVVYQDYRPNKVVIWNDGPETAKQLPLAEGRSSIKGEATVYLCRQQTCQPPVQSAEALEKLLGRPPEIRINIFNQEKKGAEVLQKEQTHFLNAMSEIFKHSGFGGKK